MPVYNLTEYNDNDSDTSGSLWQFKSDKPADLTVDNNDIFNSQSFKYKVALVGNTADAVNNRNSSVKLQK